MHRRFVTLTRDPDKLFETLGILSMIDLEKYGVLPCFAFGEFTKADTPLMLVKRFPELHIVSRTWVDHCAFIQNRYIPNAVGYYLATGNADPTMEIRFPPFDQSVATKNMGEYLEAAMQDPEAWSLECYGFPLCDMDREVKPPVLSDSSKKTDQRLEMLGRLTAMDVRGRFGN